jgi:hypothetical protein
LYHVEDFKSIANCVQDLIKDRSLYNRLQTNGVSLIEAAVYLGFSCAPYEKNITGMKIKSIALVSTFFPPSIGGPATFVSHIGPEFEALGCTVSYLNFEPYKQFSKPKRSVYFFCDLWRKDQRMSILY